MADDNGQLYPSGLGCDFSVSITYKHEDKMNNLFILDTLAALREPRPESTAASQA